MADNGAAGPEFIIQKLYVKDFSYEAPHAPDIFTRQQWQPEVNLQLENRSKAVSEDIYEDVLVVTVTVKQGDETAFLAEVHQAGLFTLKGFDEATLGRLLGVECLNVLFPYAREAISDVVTKGGFPPLLLAPVNFEQLYAEHRRKRQQEAGVTESEAQ
jgi:preprotein translocase subunit SecB